MQIPLGEQLAEIRYVRGPQVIKSEDTFLTSYVLLDRQPGSRRGRRRRGLPGVPGRADRCGRSRGARAGVTYKFAGSYENQVARANRLANDPAPGAVRSSSSSSTCSSAARHDHRHRLLGSLPWRGPGGFILIWLYGRSRGSSTSMIGGHEPARTLSRSTPSTSRWPCGWVSSPSSASPATTGWSSPPS